MAPSNTSSPAGWDSVSIGVIGAGYWGKNLVRNMAELGVLRAVCDSDVARLEQAAADYGCQTFTDPEDLLASGELDGVVIATPAPSHAGLIRRAIAAGLDVFVEKPLCLDPEEGAELVRLAAEQERILMVGHLLWYHPAVLALADLVRGGELGPILHVASSRLNLGKFRTAENVLWSFAPHDISVVLGLMGEVPTSVAAAGGAFLQDEIEDSVTALLGFPDGARAQIHVSWLYPFKEQRLVVVGDKAMAVFDDMAPSEKLKLYRHGVDWSDNGPVPVKSDAEIVEYDTDVEPLKAECTHFLERIVDRATPRTDGAEGLRVLEVLHRCTEALQKARR